MSTPLIHYVLLFECHADYFECHEVLEEAWQEGGRQDLGYAALIQYAVAHYHARRGNTIGSQKSILALKQKLAMAAADLERHGIVIDEFARQLEDWPLPEMLPLNHRLRQQIERLKLTFPATHLTFDELVHKHLYRDRTSVISERLQALDIRKKARR